MVYEQVVNAIDDGSEPKDNDFLEDVACLALNLLPARYVREDIDTSFYLSSKQRAEMEIRVYNAVHQALEKVQGSPSGPNRFDEQIEV